MIPFKAKAWLELSERRSRGERVDRHDITKHKQDIYRLTDMVSNEFKFTLPEVISQDLLRFIESARQLLVNTPQKERKAELVRLDKIAILFGLAVPSK